MNRRKRYLIGLGIVLALFGPASIDAASAAEQCEPSQSQARSRPRDTSESTAPNEQARALRAAVSALNPPASEERLWALLSRAEQIPDLEGQAPNRDAARLRLHVARSLARLSRIRAGEAAAAARASAAGHLLSVLTAPPEASTPRERTWAEGELAALYLDAGRPTEALSLARRAYSGAATEQDLLGQLRFGRLLAELLERTGDRAGALELMRRTARLGESLRRDRLGAGADDDEDTLAELNARGTTGRLLSMLLDEVESGRAQDRQAGLREVRDLLETQRSAELQDHFGDACLAETVEISPDAIAGALVLYPILLEDRVGLLTGFEGTFTYTRAPITTDALLDHASSLRGLLEKRTTRQYLRPAQHLYDALIRPLESRIEAEDVDTLVVVPDGLLRTIPFSAFHDRSTGRFLVDIKPVALVPSLRLTRPSPIARESLEVLAAGLEDATAGFERLDYTRQEIEGLRARFPATRVLFDEGFEVAALERELRARPYSIVHVATHGRVEADGSKSFLLAHDGTVGLDQMSELIQTTRFRQDQPLELLTLSACETAAGDEEAALGLAGVALRAGARSALATLWPVNDEATARLIDTFYAELSKPGQTRAGALREAQRSVRESPRFAHPGYWAPFLMISSWL